MDAGRDLWSFECDPVEELDIGQFDGKCGGLNGPAPIE